MIKRLSSIATTFFLMTTMSSIAYALSEGEIDALFEKVCKYDQFCLRLKEGDGSLRKPQEEVVTALKLMLAEINKAAQMYGVDPKSIIAPILAENSLNVSISDNIQNFLVKYRIAKNGNIPIINKQFSFGWGQLYMPAALEAEEIAYKIEGRKKRTESEIAAELLKPEGAVYYVAAVNRFNQDVYKKNGFDISDKPEILATIYNLGGARSRAKKAKASGAEPRMNYFGLFTLLHSDTMDTILSSSDLGCEVCHSDGKNFITKTNEKVMLYKNHSFCRKNDAQGIAAEVQEINNFYPAQEYRDIPQNTQFDEISYSVDCQGQNWTLLQTRDGKTGWIQDDILNTVKVKALGIEMKCKRDVSRNCMKEIQSISGDNFKSSYGGVAKIYFDGMGKADARSWSNERDWLSRCENINTSGGGFPGGSGGGMGMGIGAPGGFAQVVNGTTSVYAHPFLLKEADLLEIKNAIEKKIEEIQKFINPSSPSENPYRVIIDSKLKDIVTNVNYCLDGNSGRVSGIDFCAIDKKAFLESLNFDVNSRPTYSDLREISAKLGEYSIHIQHTIKIPTDREKAEAKLKRIEKANKILTLFAPCFDLVDSYPKDYPLFSEYKTKVENYLSDYIEEKADESSFIDLMLSNYRYKNEFLEACGAMGFAFNTPETSEYTQAQIYHCMVRNKNADSGDVHGEFSQYVQQSLDVFKTLFRNPDDRDLVLENIFKNELDGWLPRTLQIMATGNMDEKGCYDSIKTSETIEKLKNLSCVKNILNPDPWQVKKAGLIENSTGSDSKVIHGTFLEDNFYEVHAGELICE